jgi:hypothetical protein
VLKKDEKLKQSAITSKIREGRSGKNFFSSKGCEAVLKIWGCIFRLSCLVRETEFRGLCIG